MALDGADVVRVECAEQIPVPRPFTPLSARTCATVRVRVAFGGRWSARSEPATAETVLLEPGDWPARFITPGALRGIRRSARPDPRGAAGAGLASARLYATAHGVVAGGDGGTAGARTLLAIAEKLDAARPAGPHFHLTPPWYA